MESVGKAHGYGLAIGNPPGLAQLGGGLREKRKGPRSIRGHR